MAALEVCGIEVDMTVVVVEVVEEVVEVTALEVCGIEVDISPLPSLVVNVIDEVSASPAVVACVLSAKFVISTELVGVIDVAVVEDAPSSVGRAVVATVGKISLPLSVLSITVIEVAVTVEIAVVMSTTVVGIIGVVVTSITVVGGINVVLGAAVSPLPELSADAPPLAPSTQVTVMKLRKITVNFILNWC